MNIDALTITGTAIVVLLIGVVLPFLRRRGKHERSGQPDQTHTV